MTHDMQDGDRVRLTLEGVATPRGNGFGVFVLLDGADHEPTLITDAELTAPTAKVEILTPDREAAHARAIQSLLNLKEGAEIALAICPNGPVFDFLKAIQREVAQGLGASE